VPERPTTAKYGKDAERAYYLKYPGAPSPLLNELWVRREESATRVPGSGRARETERKFETTTAASEEHFPSEVARKARHPLHEYLNAAPRDDNRDDNHVGLSYELGVRVLQCRQDYPEIWQVAEELSGSRRLRQTGSLIVQLQVLVDERSSSSSALHR
jgi:hypothetical protein